MQYLLIATWKQADEANSSQESYHNDSQIFNAPDDAAAKSWVGRKIKRQAKSGITLYNASLHQISYRDFGIDPPKIAGLGELLGVEENDGI